MKVEDVLKLIKYEYNIEDVAIKIFEKIAPLCFDHDI